MSKLSKLLFLICISSLAPAFALAQDATPSRSQGYLFLGAGSSAPAGQGSLHLGGGGERLVYKGLGVGAEIGYILPADEFRGFGVFSANSSYHFRSGQASAKLAPFVTGGYSLFFRREVANLVNFGVGFDYWMRQRTGLRVELRDHVWPHEGIAHFWEFRVGVAIR